MKFNHSKELQNILNEMDIALKSIHDFGSLDGGCYMLAKSLSLKIPNSKIYAVGMNGNTNHFALSVGEHTETPFFWDEEKDNFLIDLSGAYTTRESIIDYFLENMAPKNTCKKYMEVFDHTQEYGVHPYIPNDENTIKILCDLLPENIGEVILSSKESAGV